jgi:hypothetical protein
MRRLVNVCILDEDPIHLGAFETIASGDESILMKVFDSVEDARQWTSNPELLLVNLSHDLICSNRLLLQILNAFKTATVMCYSSSKWIGMRALRTHTRTSGLSRTLKNSSWKVQKSLSYLGSDCRF